MSQATCLSSFLGKDGVVDFGCTDKYIVKVIKIYIKRKLWIKY